MSVKGFDFAWTKPTPQQVKDAGGEFIAGYFSTDISKNLNRNNIGGYLSAGLSVVTVWETSAGRALQGAAAGAWDCHMAESERAATQLPANCVHYFAVDTDTDWASVSAYFESAAGTIGKERVGIYGGIKVCEGAYAAGFRYLWQTIAWSGGNVAKHVSIYQDGETAWGGSADVDFAYGLDYGQSPRPVIPVKPPVPPVVVASEQKEIKMILVSVDKNEVPVGVDWPGVFLLGDDGKLTHVTDVESLAAYVADGVPGPKTISYAEYLTRK